MPDAKTHDVITVISGAVLTPFAYQYTLQQGVTGEQAMLGATLFLAAHLVSGIMFSPDLDLDSSIDDRWGIFFWIWRPYMWAVPHRNFWSHSLVVSPMIRLLYFYLVLILLLMGGSWLLAQVGIIFPYQHWQVTNWIVGVAQQYPRETWTVLLGFVTGSAAHSIADWLVTGGKRYLRSVGIRISGGDPVHSARIPDRGRRR